MPEIIVKYEDKVIERVVTEKKRITIGRTSDNDIVLDNRGVSRRHAQIEFNGPNAIIIDNDSLNGTFVNNRKVTEELLKDNDVITIGKYSLVFHNISDKAMRPEHMDGTMVLKTKRHKELVERDARERALVEKFGGPILKGELNTETKEFKLERDVVTVGKSKFVNVKARGFFLSGIQAKLVQEDGRWVLVNVGRAGRVKVNGESVDRYVLRNDDIIQVGKSIFRFIEGQSR